MNRTGPDVELIGEGGRKSLAVITFTVRCYDKPFYKNYFS